MKIKNTKTGKIFDIRIPKKKNPMREISRLMNQAMIVKNPSDFQKDVKETKGPYVNFREEKKSTTKIVPETGLMVEEKKKK